MPTTNRINIWGNWVDVPYQGGDQTPDQNYQAVFGQPMPKPPTAEEAFASQGTPLGPKDPNMPTTAAPPGQQWFKAPGATQWTLQPIPIWAQPNPNPGIHPGSIVGGVPGTMSDPGLNKTGPGGIQYPTSPGAGAAGGAQSGLLFGNVNSAWDTGQLVPPAPVTPPATTPSVTTPTTPITPAAVTPPGTSELNKNLLVTPPSATAGQNALTALQMLLGRGAAGGLGTYKFPDLVKQTQQRWGGFSPAAFSKP